MEWWARGSIAWFLIGLLGIADRAELLGREPGSLPQGFMLVFVMIPAVVLYKLRLPEFFVESGGGAAWLTIPGFVLVYLIPGALVFWLVRRR